MIIHELASHYTAQKLKEINKMPSKLFLTNTGKTIFITHGNEDGTILNKEFGDQTGYSEIYHCYKIPGKMTWHNITWRRHNDKLRMFLFICYDDEAAVLFDRNYIDNAIASILNSEE